MFTERISGGRLLIEHDGQSARVEDLLAALAAGTRPEALCQEYPWLELADIAAIVARDRAR